MLTVGPQTDALFQILHGINVVHPVFVHHPEHNDTLQLPHDGGGVGSFLLFVSVHSLQVKGLGEILVRFCHHPGNGALGEVEAFQFPLHDGNAAVLLGTGAHHHRRNLTAEHGQHVVPQVLAVQYLLTLCVDDLTLGIHNIIVLQNVLSGTEVDRFYIFLSIFHGTGKNLGIDGGVLIQAQRIHHAHDPVRGEQAHQVVGKAQVEAALAGIALTAGTASELVVDSPGFMALGADDEQAASCADLVRLVTDGIPVLVQQGFVLGPDGQHLGIGSLGVGVGLPQQFLGQVGLCQLCLGKEVGVAAQHDVGTAACHVGGDGDGAEFTGLGNDLGFLLVVLGVQNVVGDALPL